MAESSYGLDSSHMNDDVFEGNYTVIVLVKYDKL